MRANLLASIYRPIVGACAIVVLAVSPARSQSQESWPMLGGDPSHTGVAESPPVPLREVWSTRISAPGTVSGPVVQGSSVVVVADKTVVALDAETGEIQWETSREPGPAGPAAIEGERVVYTEGTGAQAVVTSANLKDGTESWNFAAKSPVVGGVTVDEGTAYVGGRDGNVHALALDSGDAEWSFDAAGRVETPPAVAEDLVLIVAEAFKTGRATAYGLDARTGKEKWSFSPEGVAIGASAAAIGEDLAVFGLGDLNVRALELDTGRERWSSSSRAPFSARMVPAFGDDVVIADRLGHLYRYDARTGEEKWVFRVPGSFLTGAPVLIGSTVIVGDTSGQVSAIDLDSGLLVWKEDVGDRAVPGIAVAGDRVFLSSTDGSVLALEHDPRGVLLEEASPTRLFMGRAVLNFAGAFVFLLVVLVTLFRWVDRRRRSRFPNEITAGMER